MGDSPYTAETIPPTVPRPVKYRATDLGDVRHYSNLSQVSAHGHRRSLWFPKGGASLRFCVDFRKLNAATAKDPFPLPRIDETFDVLVQLGGSRFFTTLDLSSGYWQVELNPRDKDKTAFTTSRGHFQFRVMPFGLCNAPATFQVLMELVLRGLT